MTCPQFTDDCTDQTPCPTCPHCGHADSAHPGGCCECTDPPLSEQGRAAAREFAGKALAGRRTRDEGDDRA